MRKAGLFTYGMCKLAVEQATQAAGRTGPTGKALLVCLLHRCAFLEIR